MQPGAQYGLDGWRFAALLAFLQLPTGQLEDPPARHGHLEPVQKLRGRISLVVMLALREHLPTSRPPVGVRSPLNRNSTNITGEERAEVIGVPTHSPDGGE